MDAETEAALPLVGYHGCRNLGFTSCGGVLWMQKLRLHFLWWGTVDAAIRAVLPAVGYHGCRN